MTMNRKQRRAAQKKGLTPKFDPATRFRLGYDIKVPGGLLRSDYPSQQTGAFEAQTEVELFRGAFVKMVEMFGFLQHERAVVGLVASMVNVFPKHMRGALAYAIIQGSGLIIDTDTVIVCVECGAEKKETLRLPETEEVTESEMDTLLKEDSPLLDPDSPEAKAAADAAILDAVMVDRTAHAPECSAHEKTIDEVEYRETEAVVILTPAMYEPLNAPEETDDERVPDGLRGCPECHSTNIEPTDFDATHSQCNDCGEEEYEAGTQEPFAADKELPELPNTNEAEDTARLY